MTRERKETLRSLGLQLGLTQSFVSSLSAKYGLEHAKSILGLLLRELGPATGDGRERRGRVFVAPGGAFSVRELAERCGVSYETMRKRLQRMTAADAIAVESVPKKSRGGRPQEPNSVAGMAKRLGRSRQWGAKLVRELGEKEARGRMRMLLREKERWTGIREATPESAANGGG